MLFPAAPTVASVPSPELAKVDSDRFWMVLAENGGSVAFAKGFGLTTIDHDRYLTAFRVLTAHPALPF